MAQAFPSLDKQIAEIEENLRLMAEKKAEYVQSVDVPLQLVKDEARLGAQLAKLRERRARVAEIPSPYRGLEYFDVQHADYYFGRVEIVRRLVAKVQETNFLILETLTRVPTK